MAEESQQQEPTMDIEDALAQEQVDKLEKNSAESEKTDDLSSKFAALSRKEKQLREWRESEEAKYKKMSEDYESKFSHELEQAKNKYKQDLRNKFKSTPLDALKDFELDYDTLTEMALNDGKPTVDIKVNRLENELSKRDEKIAHLEKLIEDKFSSFEEKQVEKENEVAINNFKSNIQDYIEDNTDQYELIKASQNEDTVFDIIQEHWNKTGRLMEIQDAADQLEAMLLEEQKKYFKLNKLRGLMDKSDESTPSESVPKKSGTLSNGLSAEMPSRSEKPLSIEESKRRAASYLKWND